MASTTAGSPQVPPKRRQDGTCQDGSSSDSDSMSSSSTISSSSSCSAKGRAPRTNQPMGERKLRSVSMSLPASNLPAQNTVVKIEESSAPVKVESDSSSDSESSGGDEDSEPSDLSCEEDVDVEVVAPESEHGLFKDLIVKLPERPADPTYRGNWKGAPCIGSRDFNIFATKAMKAAGVASKPLSPELDTSGKCPPLQPHQDVVQFLLHPQSPVCRLLIDHPTGSGKTLEMISVLDNFFLDPRPKVPIFPKEPVCRNFYLELLRWPSRYRDFFSCLRPELAARAARVHDWRQRREHLWDIAELPDEELKNMCNTMRETLEMKSWFYMGKMKRSKRDAFTKRFPHEQMMGSPLRALRYTSAGGRHTELKNGLPLSALLKVAFDYEGKNVYSNKIVIMDEVHNLVRKQTQFGEQLARLRELLFGAKNAVLAGFTGTPILSEASEGKHLLDIIKGQYHKQSRDQGFLSSFPMRPQPLFARTLPAGVPDAMFTPKLRRKLIQKVRLTGESLKKYDMKRAGGLPLHRLQRYCNMSTHFGSFHGSCKTKVLSDMATYAPKLHSIASAVAASPLKSLVLAARNAGMEALLQHLKEVAQKSRPPFKVATMDEIGAFNAAGNRRGEQYRVLVADATTCSEGVSFFCVREVHLADVPAAPSAFVQAVGRAVRMYGHRGLPADEQIVTTCLHIADFPRWMRSPLGAWALRAQRKKSEKGEMEKGARQLLRQLRKSGITHLDALKQRIDAIGQRQQASKEALIKEDGFGKKSELLKNGSPTKGDAMDNKVELLKNDSPTKIVVKEDEKVEIKVEEDADEKVDKETKGKIEELETAKDKDPLQTREVAALMEQLGMWEAAKAVRARLDQKNKNKKKAAPRRRTGASGKPTTKKFSQVGSLTSGKLSTARQALSSKSTPSGDPEIKSEDVPLASLRLKSGKASAGKKALPKKNAKSTGSKIKNDDMSLADFARYVKQEEKLPNDATSSTLTTPSDVGNTISMPVLDTYWRRDPLACAIQMLYIARSTEDAIESMGLKPLTADEEALKSLSLRSREFVPALAELRSRAIDRALLRQLAVDPATLSSEGESSELEFAISGSDREDKKKAHSDFLLPSGWHTEKIRRQGRDTREFVDPNGTRYRTMAEARKAVDFARSRDNMTQRFKEKYGVASQSCAMKS